MKKLLSMILSLALVFSFGTTAFAADPVTGSITINDAEKGHTYSIYKILDLYSYKDNNTEDEIYDQFVYETNETWEAFIENAVYDDKGTDSADDDVKFFVVTEITTGDDTNKFVQWNEDVPESAAKDLAILAKEYADANEISADKDPVVAESETVEFTGLELGYYLLDSTAGVLCSLDTTEPNVVLEEKNGIPTVIKNVQEDSNNIFGDNNDAAIFQEVVYEAFVNVKAGGQDYEIHDKMSEGLTYVGVSKVEIGTMSADDVFTADTTGNPIAAGTTTYTVVDHTLPDAADCECKYGAACTFCVEFEDSFVENLDGKTIRVEYKATVNADAVVEDKGNPNSIFLKYGDENETVEDTTYTFVHEFEILKYDANELEAEAGKKDSYTAAEYTAAAIDGAEFKLFDASTGGNEIPVVKIEDGKYRVASAKEIQENKDEAITTKDGKATIIGLDSTESSCRYFIEETKAPAGYNKLKNRIEVVVATYDVNEDGSVGENGDITKVEVAYLGNSRGVELPSTGGMGTTMFYVAGGLMTVGALVVLVARKRMGEAE